MFVSEKLLPVLVISLTVKVIHGKGMQNVEYIIDIDISVSEQALIFVLTKDTLYPALTGKLWVSTVSILMEIDHNNYNIVQCLYQLQL